MEEKETLIIDHEELKTILAKHYFWLDYQTDEDCFKTTNLNIKFEDEKIDHRKIQFVLKYEKKIDSFEHPIIKERIITKSEVIDIINKNLMNAGYSITDFKCQITYGISENNLNFITLKLRKKKVKQKILGGKKNV